MARRRKRSRRRGRRRNAGMPVVLVNPSNPRGRRRRRRRGRRRNPTMARRRNPSRRRRRRNPRSPSWGKAFVAFGLAGLGGGLGYGIDWGVSHAKIGAGWQAAIFGVTGGLGSVAIAKWGDERLAAGLAGATIAMTIGRVREVIALSKLASSKPAAQTTTAAGEAGAVYRQPYEAGAVYARPELGARARAPGFMAPTWKEAGAIVGRANPSYYVPGPVRYYGPQSWAYRTRDAGAVVRRYVSAHSSSR